MLDEKRYVFKMGYTNVFSGDFIQTKQYDGNLYIWDNNSGKFLDIEGKEINNVFESPPLKAIIMTVMVSKTMQEAMDNMNDEYEHYSKQLTEILTKI